MNRIRFRREPFAEYVLQMIDSNVGNQNIFNDESQLGYWIGRSYWNRNYCTEATSTLVQFAHARLGINKIYAEHQDDNPASGSVLKKLGFASVESVMKPDRTGNQTLVNVYCIDLKSYSLWPS